MSKYFLEKIKNTLKNTVLNIDFQPVNKNQLIICFKNKIKDQENKRMKTNGFFIEFQPRSSRGPFLCFASFIKNMYICFCYLLIKA
jgi:hypothetical protein